MRTVLVVMLIILVIPAVLFAQSIKIGLGVTWTQKTTMTMHYDYYWGYQYYMYDEKNYMRLSMPIWYNSNTVIEPIVSLYRVQVGDYNQTSAEFGLLTRYHPMNNRIPFVGFQFIVDGVGMGEKNQRITLGPLAGGEYFINDNFSIGGELRLDLYQEDPWDHPKRRVFLYNTYGGISTRFYFN